MNKQELQDIVGKLKERDFKIYYLLPDFDRPSGGMMFSYQHVKALIDGGYNATVLHTKDGFTLPWIGKYGEGVPIEYAGGGKDDQINFTSTLQDFIVLPEGYAEWFRAFAQTPSKKIINCQNWYYVLNGMQPGETFMHHGIKDVLSLSQPQTDYLKLIMKGLNIKYAVGYIDQEVFKEPSHWTEKEPRVMFVNNRDQNKTMNIIKTFYAIHPYFRWIRFDTPQGESFDKYVEMMQKCAFYLHADDVSSLGTAPLEAYLCGTLVAGWDGGHGGYDYMKPENTFLAPNGDIVSLAMVLGQVITRWLDCNISDEMYADMKKCGQKFSKEHTHTVVNKAFDELVVERIQELENIIARMPE